MKQRKWDCIPSGSCVHLSSPIEYVNLKGENKTVPPGKYYIVGFWANGMGIDQNRERVKSSQFDYFIPSWMLQKFDGVVE